MTTGDARVIGVALAVPEPFGTQLQQVRERFGDPLARSIPSHITLLPPTTVDGELFPEIEAHLALVAAGATSFDVRLRGTASFRPVSPVVFLVLSEGIAGCENVESGVRSGVLWRPTHFNYHPHVTVGHDLPDSVLDAVQEELADYQAAFIVDGFRLYQHLDGVWQPYRDFWFNAKAHPLD